MTKFDRNSFHFPLTRIALHLFQLGSLALRKAAWPGKKGSFGSPFGLPVAVYTVGHRILLRRCTNKPSDKAAAENKRGGRWDAILWMRASGGGGAQNTRSSELCLEDEGCRLLYYYCAVLLACSRPLQAAAAYLFTLIIMHVEVTQRWHDLTFGEQTNPFPCYLPAAWHRGTDRATSPLFPRTHQCHGWFLHSPRNKGPKHIWHGTGTIQTTMVPRRDNTFPGSPTVVRHSTIHDESVLGTTQAPSLWGWLYCVWKITMSGTEALSVHVKIGVSKARLQPHTALERPCLAEWVPASHALHSL